MDIREIRRRGKFNSPRNTKRGRSVQKKDLLQLLDVSTTSRVKPNERLTSENAAEFKTVLEKKVALRHHKTKLSEKEKISRDDFVAALKEQDRKIGDKQTPVQRRRMVRNTGWEETLEAPRSSRSQSSHLQRLHAALEDDSPDKPYKPAIKIHFLKEFGRLRAVRYGPDGYLYITTSNTDGRGEARAGDDKLIRINPAIFN